MDSRIATRKRAELLAGLRGLDRAALDADSETLDFQLVRRLAAGFRPDALAALAALARVSP